MSLKIKSYRACQILFTLSMFYGAQRLSNKYMHGFSHLNFSIKPPQNYKIKTTASEHLDLILNQPFTFLGYGGESLVFSSKDDQFVLKVFKKHRLYPYFELNFIKFLPFIDQSLSSRQNIYYRFWDSLKLQAEQCLEESAITYIHLPSHNKNLSPITLIDPCGSKHKMDLNQICFVIQKKGDLFETVYLKTKDPEIRKQMLKSLLKLYSDLKNKNLYIWDNAIYRNLGWIEGKPFLIDTGSIRKNPSSEEILKNINDLKAWVLKNDKDSYETFLSMIASH